MSHDTKIPEYIQENIPQDIIEQNVIHIPDESKVIIMPMSWHDYYFYKQQLGQCDSKLEAEEKLEQFRMQTTPPDHTDPLFGRRESIYAFLFLSIVFKHDYNLNSILHFWGDEINFNLHIIHPVQGSNIHYPGLFFMRSPLHCKPLRLAIEQNNDYAKEAIIHFLSQHY